MPLAKEGENSRSSEGFLRKLLQLATLTFTDMAAKNKQNSESSCKCGHVCSGGNGNVNANKSNLARSPSVNRNAKTGKYGPAKMQDSIAATSGEHGEFLVPLNAPPQSKAQANKSFQSILQQTKLYDNAFKEQLDKLSTCKARGRVRKSVVVQRELLPKTSLTHSMMTLRLVPTTSQLAGSFVPVLQPAVALATTPASGLATIPKVVKLTPTRVVKTPMSRNDVVVSATSAPTIVSATVAMTSDVTSFPPQLGMMTTATVTTTTTTADMKTPTNNSEASVPTSSVLELSIPEQTLPTITSGFSASPPSISLFDLPNCEVLQTDNVGISLDLPEKLLDITLGNSTSSFSAYNLSSSISENKTLENGNTLPVLPTSLDSVPIVSSTTSPFKGLESNWLNGETGDISLSSLLNHLDSPLKTSAPQPLAVVSEDTSCGRLSSDVDTQVMCLMNESSIDYVAKFADLAAQIVETPKKLATSPTQPM